MNKFYLLIITVFSCAVLFSSCRKDVVQSEIIKEYTIDTTINAGSTFTLGLSSVFSPGKKATIIEQASYFTISSIDAVEGSDAPVYTYKGTGKAGDTDRVTLAISDLDDGTRKISNDSTILYINLSFQ